MSQSQGSQRFLQQKIVDPQFIQLLTPMNYMKGGESSTMNYVNQEKRTDANNTEMPSLDNFGAYAENALKNTK